MAPIKFEDNIREKLQERELTPSPKTWEQLEAQLDRQPQGRNKGYWWLGIAASVVGIATIGFLLNLNGAAEVDTILVDANEKIEQKDPILRDKILENEVLTNIEDEDLEEISKEVTPIKIESTEIISQEIASENTQESTNQKTNTTKKIQEPVFIQNKKASEAIATVIEYKGSNPIIQMEKKELHKSFVDQKVEEVVAQIGKNNTEITVEEIDALLANAQRDLQTRKILDQASGKVDATALLDEVEFELERSFRDKVFDALGDQFNKVRTAVSERNN